MPNGIFKLGIIRMYVHRLVIRAYIHGFLISTWRHSRLKVGSVYPYAPNTLYKPHHIEATGFSAAFPGIKRHLLTLASNFKMPFYRDILMALGM